MPRNTHSPPSRVAVVAMSYQLEPASGSVIANAITISPLAIPGSQRCFCSSAPNASMIVPQIAGDTTVINNGQPARRGAHYYTSIMFGATITALADVRQVVGVLPEVRPGAWGTVPRCWKITPKMKLKRKPIHAKYAAEIDVLYAE